MAKKSSKKNGNSKLPIIIFLIIVAGVLLFLDAKGIISIDFKQLLENQKIDIKINDPVISAEPAEPAKTEPQKTETQKQPEIKSEPKTETKTETVSKPANGFISLKNLEIPVCGLHKKAKDHELRKFENYQICYRESYEQAEWSAYELQLSELKKNSERSNDFRPDPEISTGSATLADYKGSGYDRGHLSPAADFSFSEKAMSETFYMSNMSPQFPDLNRGTWQELESKVRDWSRKFGRVYVISGPVLEKPASEYESIGANKVSVPQYYYKVVLAPVYENKEDSKTPDDAKSVITIGFILPNKKCDGTFWNYAVSVDEVEKRTNLDFFSLLDDDIEKKVEKSFDLSLWK